MSLELKWMRPDAPYMPIATIGLLSALEDSGHPATAYWQSDRAVPSLAIETDLSAVEVAQAILNAPWPDLGKIPWRGKVGQAIKPMLASAEDPVSELHRLRKAVRDAGQVAELRLLESYVTEASLDGNGVPNRSRLLRGVKADLSGIAEKVKLQPGKLTKEVSEGPVWRSGKSGRGLGLLPEVQTFGGTTGPTPADVGNHSVLLYRLLWLGILSLPPVAVVVRGHRIVGGPLVTDRESISWPVWTVPLDVYGLRAFFSLAGLHAEKPETALQQRGVAAVYRARAVPINSMIAVFRWGERVA